MQRLSRDHTVPVDQRYRVLEPALTVTAGETIVVETINHMAPVVRSEQDLHPHGSPGYREREETGPIYVRGAHPGDALAIRVERIELVGLPHAHGSGPLAEAYPQAPLSFPVEDAHCKLPGGLRVALAPMIGDIYTTPLSPSGPYCDHGGNMDFTEVRSGNTLYLPVFHEGGLLVMGDVHAFQGDGELFGEGGECAADVTVTISIDRRYRSPRPLVETPDAIICLACRDRLFDAVKLATEDMVALLRRLHSVSGEDAYVFCTMAGSVRVGRSLARPEWTERSILVGLSVPKHIR